MTLVRKSIVFFLCLLLPNKLIFWLLNLLGHKVHSSAKIGFSFLWISGVLELRKNSKIGHFNAIRIDNIQIESQGNVGNFNRFNGPFDIVLAERAAFGNGNKCYRAPLGVTYGKSVLRLGQLSKITGNHRVDCTRSITIGDFTTIAGNDSQLWTHAYYHENVGPGRIRVDGEIVIGNNVNIGSQCVLNCNIKIADNVVVGSNCCVSKSLLKPGTYVNQQLRFIEPSDEDLRNRFSKIEGFTLCEEVYERRSDPSN